MLDRLILPPVPVRLERNEILIASAHACPELARELDFAHAWVIVGGVSADQSGRRAHCAGENCEVGRPLS